MSKWYLASMNDGLVIVDQPPRPNATDSPPQIHKDGPNMVINVHGLSVEQAQRIVDTHNSKG